VVTGAFFSGLVYVTTLSVMGTGPMGPTFAAISRYWIGDTVGLVVMLPMLLIVIDRKRRAAMIDVLKNRHWWAVAALICVLLWVIFGLAREDQFKFYYLLFLPVVWISARFGMPGAVLASGLTQLGLILAVQSAPHPDIAVFELQLLMAAITMTGLLLGVTVDERERAETALRGSLRLAAAGQMAAALAHELSQPLTALSTYAQACQILVASATDLHPDQRGQLENVAQRMVDDAGRAGNVIKRLRDFFRTGSTHLSSVAPAQILQEAAKAHSRRADALQIRIDSEIQETMPKVWMDSVQIAVVLRNLIANAIDSASSVGAGGLVTIRATSTDRELEVEIQDSGPGVDKDRLHSLFEAGTSDKPGGMGLGLSICRAIVEAHGGKLWAEDGPGGKFRFTLPVENDSHSGVQGAP
jgi:signal transduction histidine kinase